MGVRRGLGALSIVVVIASACGGTAPPSATTPTSAPASGGVATEAPSSAGSSVPSSAATGVVKVLLVGMPDEDSINPTTGAKIPGVSHLKEAFTAANPGIDMQITNIPWGEGSTGYGPKTQAMVTANEACVYLMPGAFDFGRQGVLEDLQPWIDKDPTMKDAFLGDSLAAYTGWGPSNPRSVWGIPYTGGTRVIHWDSKLFKDWGVEPLSLHPTLDEIHDKAAKMTGKNPVTGEQNYGYWFQGKYINWQFQVIAHALGANWGKVNDDGSWTITWDTPEYLAGLQWLVDMTKYAPPGALAADAMPDGFLTDSNAVAIIPEGEPGYYLQTFVANPALADRFRSTYNVEGADGKGGLFATDPLSLVKSCDNKDAAWAGHEVADDGQGGAALELRGRRQHPGREGRRGHRAGGRQASRRGPDPEPERHRRGALPVGSVPAAVVAPVGHRGGDRGHDHPEAGARAGPEGDRRLAQGAAPEPVTPGTPT